MADYVLPQVIVFQEFAITPTALETPLRAVIVGEHFALNRYSDSDEKPNIRITSSYNPDADEAFLWPNRQPASVVDETFSKVFVDGALLEYFFDPGGDGSEIRVVSGTRNQLRFDALVLADGNGFSRSAGFGDRDVAVGDIVDIVASACGEPFNIRSTILGLVADIVPEVIGDAESEVINQGDRTVGSSSAQSSGDVNAVEISAVDASAYDGREDGQVQETYVVTVISPSTGSDATTGLLQVIRQSDGQVSEEVPAAFGAPTTIGDRGATVTWDNGGAGSALPGVDPDDFVLGQEFTITVNQSFDEVEAESGGVYKGAFDTTYVVEVTKGGDFGTAEIATTTNTGVDSSPSVVVPALGTAVPIGSQGLTIKFIDATFGLNLGDRFTIAVEQESVGAIKTAQIATPLPPELRGICEVDLGGGSSSSSSGAAPDLAVTFYIQSDIEVPEDRAGEAPLVNWEQSDTEVTLKAGIKAFDASYTVNGILTALPVKDGVVYVEHRDRLSTWCDKVGAIKDVGDIDDVFSTGPIIDPDNPLVFGVFKALENAGGVDVKFSAVCSNSPVTLDDWVQALDALQGRDDVYSLVPLTHDKAVQDAFVGHALAQSSADVGRWRIVWLNRLAEETKAVYTESTALGADDDEPVLATITDDPETSGTQFTFLNAAGEHFLTDIDTEVRAGDIVRTNFIDDGFGNISFDEFVIDEILNDEDIRLFTGPSSAIITASKIEIYRNLSRTELSEELALYPGESGSTRRAFLVWPDEIGNAGKVFEGFFLCASLAGLRSGSLPHRPLTNVEIVGYDDVSRTTEFFTESQLNTLAGAGWWIVTQDQNDGQIFTRHQLSTDNLDLLRREQSITTNVDSMSFTFLNRLKPFIGRANITPVMINIIEAEILSILDFFQNFSVNDIVGPQLLASSIATLEQHPLLKDRLLVIINITVPAPLNNIELHLRVAV